MKVKVEGMSCNHCKMRVEKALKSVEGIEDAVVDLDDKSVEIKGNVGLDKIKEVIEDTGYDFVGEA